MENILKIPGKIFISTFAITFEYDTKRNNRRKRNVQIKANTEEDAKFWFNVWWQSYNERNPFKAYSNVKILECVQTERDLVESL